jgi:hypothetical protein
MTHVKLLIILFPLVFLGSKSYAQPNLAPPKSIIQISAIDTIISLEKIFSDNDSILAPEGKAWFEFKTGSKKILLIAPHATAQTREGKIKQPDTGTGSLAMELHKLADVPILYTTYLSPFDPNFYDDNEFKDSLSHILNWIDPVIVLDLHCSHPFHPYDIDFGTMNQKSYINREDLLLSLKSKLIEAGLINQSQDFFSAEKNQTVTKFVSKRGIPAIQLEINSNYLSAGSSNLESQKTAQLLEGLLKFINETQQNINSKKK